MKNPEITVAIAAYNAEKYIAACIESVLSQTFSDFELIVADDGSDDKTLEVCRARAEKDGRIRIISLRHGGVAAARNALVAAANGEYLAFIDSDDVVHPQYLEILYFAVSAAKADMAVCAFSEFTEGMPDMPPIDKPYAYRALSVDKALRDMVDFSDNDYIKYIFPQCKLYRTDIMRKTRYPEGRIYEDEAISGELLYYCARGVAEVNYRLYYYYRNMSGITKSPVSEKSLDVGYAIEYKMEFFADKPDCRDVYLALVKDGYNVYYKKWRRLVGSELPSDVKKRFWNMFVAYYKKYKRTVKPSYKEYYLFYSALHPALKPYYFLRYALEKNGFKGSLKKLFKRKKS